MPLIGYTVRRVTVTVTVWVGVGVCEALYWCAPCILHVCTSCRPQPSQNMLLHLCRDSTAIKYDAYERV